MVMELNRKDERPDVVMNLQDKESINRFSRRLARKNELKVLIGRRKKLLQVHDDAGDELLLMDDDETVHYTIGDIFIVDEKEQIEAALDRTKAELGRDIETYEEELRNVVEEMTLLKASLYAKFGKVRGALSSSYFFFFFLALAASLYIPMSCYKVGGLDVSLTLGFPLALFSRFCCVRCAGSTVPRLSISRSKAIARGALRYS